MRIEIRLVLSVPGRFGMLTKGMRGADGAGETVIALGSVVISSPRLQPLRGDPIAWRVGQIGDVAVFVFCDLESPFEFPVPIPHRHSWNLGSGPVLPSRSGVSRYRTAESRPRRAVAGDAPVGESVRRHAKDRAGLIGAEAGAESQIVRGWHLVEATMGSPDRGGGASGVTLFWQERRYHSSRRLRSISMKLSTLALALTLTVFGQQHPLTNADVVGLVQQGSSPAAIIKTIKASSAVDFRISPEYLPQLEKAGVPREVIDAMIRRVMEDESRPSGRPPQVQQPKNPVAMKARPVPDTPASAHAEQAAISPPDASSPAPAGPTLTLPARKTGTELPVSPRSAGAGKSNDMLIVTSIPEGATVEWNRKIIGTTPLSYKVGEYAFNSRKLTAFSKHLRQPVTLRVSKEGYVAREVEISKHMVETGANGKVLFYFYVIPTNNFQIDLDKVAAVHTAMTNADVVKLKAAGFGTI